MSNQTIIGVDLGGTKIAAAKFDALFWELLDKKRCETHADKGFSHVLEDLIALVEQLQDESTTGIGIGVPGLVRQPDGIVLRMPNIPEAESFALKNELSRRFPLNIGVDNDANCFVLSEALHGGGKGHNVVVGITLGTGVGGGIVIDGKILHGSRGYAGEIGHMLLLPGQPPYETDDKRGDIEQFFSGTAMGKRCEAASDPNDYLQGTVCEFMHKDIAKEVAWMCTNIIHLLDPSIIIFGGSAGHALKPHLGTVQQELQNWILPGTPLPELAIAELEDAAMLGAAMLVAN